MGVSRGQPATSRSHTSAIRSDSRSIFSPWKAGSISLRCSMCASPSSRSTELVPTIGSSIRAPAAGMQHVGRRGEHLLDLAGIGEHHERRRLRAAGS